MPADSRTALNAATSGTPEAPPEGSPGPEPYKFSLDEAYAIGETGIFRGTDVELIGGQFLIREPGLPPHSGMVNRLVEWFRERPDAAPILHVQNPLQVSTLDLPVPDVTLLRRRSDLYESSHPGPEDVLLVIEVANTSLRYDQSTKAPLYAAAGIETYWIVDVNAETVHVHTDPCNERYENVQVRERGDMLLLPVPDAAQLPVSDLFPDTKPNQNDKP